MQLADSILNKVDSSNIETDTTSFVFTKPYNLLKEQLRTYYDIAQKGGWQSITTGTQKLKKGISSPVVTAIKKRLKLTGEYKGNDSTQVYNDSLEAAIKLYKIRHGFDSTGNISDSLINDMNISATHRV